MSGARWVSLLVECGCVLLATINIEMLAFMPCNLYRIVRKGIVVREVDAFGRRDGQEYRQELPSGLRAQVIKSFIPKEMRKTVENQENLTCGKTMINEILVEDAGVS